MLALGVSHRDMLRWPSVQGDWDGEGVVWLTHFGRAIVLGARESNAECFDLRQRAPYTACFC